MPDPRFTTFATNVSPDASAISRDFGRRALGKLDETALRELLEKFAALASAADDDSDPHVTVTGRVGTFAIRASSATTVLVYDVTDASRNFLKIKVADVAAFLDYGPSGLPPETATESVTAPEIAESPQPQPRSKLKPAFAFSGAIVGLTALAVSAQMSFSPEPLDADVPYTAVTSAAEIATIRANVAGDYRADNETQCSLTIQADGMIHYVTRETDGDVAADRLVRSELALLGNQTPVFRTEIGPIEVRDSKSVRFAGEVFTRTR
ncbi:MAG: hypothetical protein JNL39_07590 [Opitutaceae bacterium]|nr:hypothetical protein [Opitutaceae bacterium]